MRRVLLWASAAWTLGYAAVYVAVVEGQDGGPAIWYLVLLIVAAVLLAGAALRQIRVAHVAALVVLLACTVLGLLSVGLLLLPAAAASAVALVPPTGRRGAPPRTDDPLH